MPHSFANILFLDIETVPEYSSYISMDEDMQQLWNKKSSKSYLTRDEEMSPADLYDDRAGIFAEFGKIVCICVGYVVKNAEQQLERREKSFSGHDEKVVLQDFFALLETHFTQSKLCGHNILEFDIPYICRRGVINNLALPNILDLSGKKPREVQHIDTLEMRKFGDRKNFISLELLTKVLGLPTPKSDISGSEVAGVYYQQNDLPRIVQYCQRDVRAVMQVVKRFWNIQQNIIEPSL